MCVLKLVLPLFVVFVTANTSTWKNINVLDNVGEVIFVSVIARHGARAPDKTYATDPHKDAFPEGLGELLNEGKSEQYELGKWLRRRYGRLLTDTYSPQLIEVLASDKDRVLMSAQSCLAGMYPPTGRQVWSPDLPWQPIPVHTMPQDMDKILAMKAPCAEYEKELKSVLASDEVKALSKKYQYIVDILNNNTGDIRNDYKYIANIYDTLKVQSEHNLKLPPWSNSIFPEKMEEATILRFTLPTWNKRLARLKTGPLLQELVNNMETKIKNKSSKKVMQLYAAHDTTIVNLLNTLDVWDRKLLPYSTCVLLELRRCFSGSYYVTLYIRTPADKDPQLLTLPGCDSVCPLDKFTAIVQPFIPPDWNSECNGNKTAAI